MFPGPLLPEQLVVQKIPLQQIEDLTHILSGKAMCHSRVLDY